MSGAGKRYVSILFHTQVQDSFIHTFGKAIFELIATEGAYVRDLQLIVEVCGPFLYIIDDLTIHFYGCKYRYSTRTC